MAENDVLRFERRANHVVLTLNRPEKRNALNGAVFEALDRAFSAIEADKSIRAMVLRGEGAAFSSGVDLRELEQVELADAGPSARRRPSGASRRCLSRRSRRCRARR